MSVSLAIPTSMFFSLRTLKKVLRRDLNSLRSMVSSPLMSSRLKMSSISSVEGSSPPTRLISVFTTFGNSVFVKRWFLSASNSLKIFYRSTGMSFSLKLRLPELILYL